MSETDRTFILKAIDDLRREVEEGIFDTYELNIGSDVEDVTKPGDEAYQYTAGRRKTFRLSMWKPDGEDRRS